MTSLICNAPFCENTIAKKSYVYCWVHRAEREKYKVRKMEFVMPLWSVKNCKVHGHLRRHETIASHSNPSGNNSPRCKYCKKIKHPYCAIKSKIANDRNKDRRRQQRLIRQYKISTDEYNIMLIKQNHLCCVCKKKQCKFSKNSNKIRSLAVDHNHKTGKVRGLLCTSCNTAIGLLDESFATVESLLKYLRLHEEA